MRKIKFSSRIVMFSILIFVIVLSVVSILITQNVSRLEIDYNIEIFENVSKSYAQKIDEYLKKVETLSTDIIYNDEIRDALLYGEEIEDSYLGFETAASQSSTYFEIVDNEGNSIFSNGSPHSKPWANFDFTSYKDVWTEFSISKKAYPNDSGYVNTMSYYRKIEYLEKREIVSAGVLRIDILDGSILNQFMSSPYDAFLVDENGDVIINNNVSSLAKEYFQNSEMFNAQNGSGYEIVVGSETMHVNCVKLQSNGWSLVSVLPETSLMVRLNNTILLIILFLLVCFSILALSIFLSTFFIVNPVKRLAQKINGYYKNVKGADMAEISQKTDYVTFLDNCFENMKSRVDTLITEVYESNMEEKDSKLRFLQAQINPHFLHNTLETIRFTARLNDDLQTEAQIMSLSTIVRAMFNNRDKVTLKEELELARGYLFLQKERLGESVLDNYEIDENTYDCLVPGLVLQPLIENSFEHGFDGNDIEISIKTMIKEDKLIIRVADNGVGCDCEKVKELLKEPTGKHVALYNINKRIKLYYGEKYQLCVEENLPRGMVINLTLPIIKSINGGKP